MSAKVTTTEPIVAPTLEQLQLQYQVETFLKREAEALDNRRFDDWLAMLAEDLWCHMPIRRNVKLGQQAQRENTDPDKDISWFNEDKWTLSKRVAQIKTGAHWAEEPLSRVCHLVSNVLVHAVRPITDGGIEVDISNRFVIYQNRVDYDTALFAGRRYDTLRRDADDFWLLAKREIMLDQSVLLAKNLTVFF